MDINGNAITHLGQSDKAILDGQYIGDSFYHTSYQEGRRDTDPSISKIYKCTVTNYDCTQIYSTRGSISCLFGLNDRIFFFHSRVWKKVPRGRSYNQFIIRSTAKSAGGAIPEYRRSFVPDMCPIVVADTAYGSFSIPFENTLQIFDNEAFSRSDRIIKLVNGKIEIDQSDLEPRGSVNLLMHIPDLDLNYMGLNNGKGFVYGNCINLRTCEVKKKQTNPAIVGGVIYYGEWDNETEKISINVLE